MIDKKKLSFVAKTLGMCTLIFIVGLTIAGLSTVVHELGHTLIAWVLGAEIDWGNWITIQKEYMAATGIGPGLSPGEEEVMRLGGGLFAFLIYFPISIFLWRTRRIPGTRRIPVRNIFAIVFLSVAVIQLVSGILEGFFPEIYYFPLRNY